MCSGENPGRVGVNKHERNDGVRGKVSQRVECRRSEMVGKELVAGELGTLSPPSPTISLGWSAYGEPRALAQGKVLGLQQLSGAEWWSAVIQPMELGTHRAPSCNLSSESKGGISGLGTCGGPGGRLILSSLAPSRPVPGPAEKPPGASPAGPASTQPAAAEARGLRPSLQPVAQYL